MICFEGRIEYGAGSNNFLPKERENARRIHRGLAIRNTKSHYGGVCETSVESMNFTKLYTIFV